VLVKVLTWLLALLFVAAGVQKVLALGSAATEFARLGYSAGFRLLIGALEIVGGVALLVPAAALWGAALLLAIMVGATWTLVTVGDSPVPPLIVGALLAVLVATRLRSPAR
jgi:uncharacterized membrane protein YphA (DoxX/SURF4 family)